MEVPHYVSVGEWMSDLKTQLERLPTGPGVYSFFDPAGKLLYIGKSVNVRTRVRSYFRPNGGHTRRTARLKNEATRIEVQRCGSELEALLVESQQIKRLQPLYNVLGRTYRHFPFIKIPAGPFPQVELTYQLQEDGARYYGPFPSEYRAREALEAMRPLFKWRSCTPMASRVCFEHAIGRCSAPCVGLIDAAGYRQAMDDLEGFLTGQGGAHLQRLERQMEEASASLMFERAAILRDRLAMLRPLVQRQDALQSAISELDCVVVLPAATPGEHLWLLVRRGRLVETFQGVTTRHRKSVMRRLAAAIALPPPDLTVRQWELDEINIISSWLHKNREDEAAITLANRPLDEAVDEGFALMAQAKRPARRVAERASERVIVGPEEA
jgi:excinuclease UvrABC nuclease subunit